LTSFIEFSFYLFFYYFLNVFFLTIRVKVYGTKDVLKPAFILFWHGKMLPLIYVFKNMSVYVLISLSRDGEIASNVIKLFGFKSIRGSSSKGGFEALNDILKVFKSGKYIVITPDGPRGPRGKIDLKKVQILMRFGKVYCLEVKGNGFRLNTWDRFFIPYPFSEIKIYLRECKDLSKINELMGEL